jgi:hypothetical protein
MHKILIAASWAIWIAFVLAYQGDVDIIDTDQIFLSWLEFNCWATLIVGCISDLSDAIRK